MKKNQKKIKLEIVDLEKFTGLCVITVLGYGERCVKLLREQGMLLWRAKRMGRNYVFWGALKCLESDFGLGKFDTASAIVSHPNA